MTLNHHENSIEGASKTRAEMTGAEIKKGRTFWKIYTLLFLALAIALAATALIMIRQDQPYQQTPSVSGPQPDSDQPQISSQPDQDAPPPNYVPEPPAPLNEAPAEKSELTTLNANDGPSPLPEIKIADFYQDENGIWRNGAKSNISEFYQDSQGIWRNRRPSPTLTDPKPNGSNWASVVEQILSSYQNEGQHSNYQEGPDSPQKLGVLLTSGVIQALGGDDLLNENTLKAIGGFIDMAGNIQSGGPIGGLSSTGLNGASNSGDISHFIKMLTGSQITSSPRPNTIFTRVNPVSSGADPALKTQQGLHLEGYEYFDPNKPDQVESDWDYFSGDYPEVKRQ